METDLQCCGCSAVGLFLFGKLRMKSVFLLEGYFALCYTKCIKFGNDVGGLRKFV